MNACEFILLGLNFAFLAVLPIIFFKRDGRANAMWWMNTSPFVISVASVTASMMGVLPPVTGYDTQLTATLAMLALPLNVASIGLMAFTLGSHRIPIALWHQTNDAPVHIVTWGAYSKIRHPFYASFILLLTSAFLFCPQMITAVTLAIGVTLLNFTAAREEAKLSRSQFGDEYREYMGHTGRFLPRIMVKSNG
jgi:protein-S-isoprenylcysteine O-methyltransferase Ste14